MDNKWEDKFVFWTKRLSNTEEEKCGNAERMIKDAIKEYSELSEKKIEVFAQGSYCNNTNVKQNSDVDICVVCMGPFFAISPQVKIKVTFSLLILIMNLMNLKIVLKEH